MNTISDIYSNLCMLGVKKGYSVVPEFKIELEGDDKPSGVYRKHVDLAWVKKLGSKTDGIGNFQEWELHYLFEVEGCNVAGDRVQQHIDNFNTLMDDSRLKQEGFVFLYTNAIDRKVWNVTNPDDYVKQHQKDYGASVFGDDYLGKIESLPDCP